MFQKTARFVLLLIRIMSTRESRGVLLEHIGNASLWKNYNTSDRANSQSKDYYKMLEQRLKLPGMKNIENFRNVQNEHIKHVNLQKYKDKYKERKDDDLKNQIGELTQKILALNVKKEENMKILSDQNKIEIKDHENELHFKDMVEVGFREMKKLQTIYKKNKNIVSLLETKIISLTSDYYNFKSLVKISQKRKENAKSKFVSRYKKGHIDDIVNKYTNLEIKNNKRQNEIGNLRTSFKSNKPKNVIEAMNKKKMSIEKSNVSSFSDSGSMEDKHLVPHARKNEFDHINRHFAHPKIDFLVNVPSSKIIRESMANLRRSIFQNRKVFLEKSLSKHSVKNRKSKQMDESDSFNKTDNSFESSQNLLKEKEKIDSLFQLPSMSSSMFNSEENVNKNDYNNSTVINKKTTKLENNISDFQIRGANRKQMPKNLNRFEIFSIGIEISQAELADDRYELSNEEDIMSDKGIRVIEFYISKKNQLCGFQMTYLDTKNQLISGDFHGLMSAKKQKVYLSNNEKIVSIYGGSDSSSVTYMKFITSTGKIINMGAEDMNEDHKIHKFSIHSVMYLVKMSSIFDLTTKRFMQISYQFFKKLDDFIENQH
jgi:hypothetical protein